MYRKANEAPNGDPSICDFFVQYKNDEIETLDTDVENTELSEIGQQMRGFVHRNGRFFAYLTREEEEHKEEEDCQM